MYYILTTYFQDHWDKIRNNKTSYLRKFLMVSEDDLTNNIQTIFLRITRPNGDIEKAWLGKVYNIEITNDKINFSVSIDREIEVDPEFARTKIGWYVINEQLDLHQNLPADNTGNLNVQELSGNWDKGWALDIHTLHSVKIGDGKFDTTYTYLGNALNKLKYWKDKSYFPVIIDVAADFLKNNLNLIDAIIPVPPSDITRSFQPVYEMAKLLSIKVNKLVDTDYLIKVKTTSQLKSLNDPAAREEILKGAFDIKSNKYEGKNILLFDDLYRSGATLTEITNILKSKGKVKNVYVLTITKTRTKR